VGGNGRLNDDGIGFAVEAYEYVGEAGMGGSLLGDGEGEREQTDIICLLRMVSMLSGGHKLLPLVVLMMRITNVVHRRAESEHLVDQVQGTGTCEEDSGW
jgi:hypothetical protein